MQCVIKCVAFPNVKISIGEEDTSELEKQIQYYFEKENFSKSKRVQFFKECFSNLNGAVSKTDILLMRRMNRYIFMMMQIEQSWR